MFHALGEEIEPENMSRLRVYEANPSQERQSAKFEVGMNFLI